MSDPVRNSIVQLVETLPAPIREASGAVLYAGWSSLRPSPIYVMGFNPGGDPGKPPHNEISLMDEMRNVPEHWSSYVDCVWDRAKKPGARPHQKRVCSLFEAAGVDPRAGFAANAIFIRTRTAADLPDPVGLFERHFWPIHQVFLSIVRPRVIVCLGNGGGRSSWTLLLSQASAPPAFEPSNGFREGRFATASFDVGGEAHECLVIGTPHPSRFRLPDKVLARITEVSGHS